MPDDERPPLTRSTEVKVPAADGGRGIRITLDDDGVRVIQERLSLHPPALDPRDVWRAIEALLADRQ